MVLAGGSGAGKSFILQNIAKINDELGEAYPKYKVVKKYTTRKKRENESDEFPDLRFVDSTRDFENCGGFIYPYGKYYYGIDCSEIDNIFRDGMNPILIVRDLTIIKMLKRRYRCVTDIYCSSGYSGQDLESILKNSGCSVQEITERMNNIPHDQGQLYYSDHQFYTRLTNWYDDTFLKELINVLSSAPRIDQQSICIIAAEQSTLDTIKMGVGTDRNVNIQMILSKSILKEKTEEKEAYNQRKSKLVNTISQSKLVFADITVKNDTDKTSLFRWIAVLISIKTAKEIILIAHRDTQVPFDMPFDIYNYKVYTYDTLEGNIFDVIEDKVGENFL